MAVKLIIAFFVGFILCLFLVSIFLKRINKANERKPSSYQQGCMATRNTDSKKKN
ncbi:TPA: hypothetical protein NHV36_006118 [Klebsiella michiganensis]|uniref:hypothetical protein n=1 Tax=Klebsiella michiganensis TaxID=1134687 RepID=UPI000D544214|nr:hypothetical protein [Klebsiella michiganensis]QLX18571.1 hypothetical protein HV230_28915 [Klebsiella oxytoca]AWF56219.1 hypothetical protein CSC12_6311 [Klebsiella michiganensis]MCW9490455.1 hypothetical protein [Klebsiella michiganensis]MDU7883560.1 hypothetical protein [Klebsiella michiganensis]HCE8860666.1 hypothetical protein [Klebsiella michiganensis]